MMTITDQIEAIELLKIARKVIEDERDNADLRHDISDEYADWERMLDMDDLLKRIDTLLDLKGRGDE